MAMLLKGAEVAKALTEGLHAKTEELKKNGVEPCLAILRVGAREDDLAYERGALKRCEKVGVAVRQVVLPEDVTQEVLMENIHALGADEKVHGVLMFRPLPGHLDDEAARAALDPKKDMDGITDGYFVYGVRVFFFIARADKAVHFLPVLKKNNAGNAHYAETLGKVYFVVNVYLAYIRAAVVILAKLLHNGTYHAARAAPACPEVHKHRP